MSRLAIAGYGLACYTIFVATLAYFIGFMTDIAVPKSVDDGIDMPWPMAMALDLSLIGLFAVQHTIMVRPGFKRILDSVLPRACERTTFVLASSIVLMLLCILWAPLPGTLWEATAPWLRGFLWTVCGFGWGLALVSTFQFDHFGLFGLRQVWNHLRGQPPVAPAEFSIPYLYQWVRHPMMTGFLIAFWVMPDMSASQALLAAGLTLYIVLGTGHEERGLMREFGDNYRNYIATTPRFFPRFPR